jgi:hypothetical protein
MTTRTVLESSFLYHRRNRGMGARAALEYARRDVDTGTRRYPCQARGNGGGVWQRPDDMPRHATPRDRAFYSDTWPLQDMGPAHDVMRHAGRRMDHTGWYTDPRGDGGLIVGHVLRLPGRGYVPGAMDTDSDGVTCWPCEVYDTPEDAARAADSHAERIAEREREYREAWQHGQECAELDSEAADLRREILAITADLRTARRAVAEVSGAVARLCERARADVRADLAQIRKLRRKRDDIRDTWRNRDGFGDGYGETWHPKESLV